ncbi:MAG: hypothetical protein DHS20C05_18060 [Hyphococcus sp.]|nr:MAG: hypothetical protein DHS20C05_18060 [Marinicaulis sp.]
MILKSTPNFTDFLNALKTIPENVSIRLWRGQQYQTTKQSLQNGKLIKLYAESLAHKDHVSFNLYRLVAGDQLKPCEMPEGKVIDFVVNSQAS